jgi:peptidoglycan/xylan/chitin deacetylase (PgdA/CDA1 family)
MFWTNNAQIAVTTSLMFEAGSQDQQKPYGPFPVAQEGNFPDLPTNSWFDYAANEGIPRALELFDRHGVKATSFSHFGRARKSPRAGEAQVETAHQDPVGNTTPPGKG